MNDGRIATTGLVWGGFYQKGGAAPRFCGGRFADSLAQEGAAADRGPVRGTSGRRPRRLGVGSRHRSGPARPRSPREKRSGARVAATGP